MKDCYVKKGQRVREDEIVVNPCNFSAQVDKLIFTEHFFCSKIMTVSSWTQNHVKNVCQSGQNYRCNHKIAIFKVINVDLCFEKHWRYRVWIGWLILSRNKNFTVSIGVLETVESEHIWLRIIRKNDPDKVNELNKLNSFQPNQFMEISRNNKAT